MRIVLHPNFKKVNALPTALKVCDILDGLGMEIVISDNYRTEFAEKSYVIFKNIRKAVQECDIVIAIGGDGTILKASAYASEYDKLLLGINTGHLGFMASMEIDELDNLSKLKTSDYTVETRMMLDIEQMRNGNRISYHTALNDVVIARPYSKITDFEVETDGITVSSLRADGVVFSTPTGSTAYALSAGGPIIEPRLDCIQFTPICPHSLFSRTMLFSTDRKIVLRHISDEGAAVYFSVDGHEGIELNSEDRLVISKSVKKLRLIDIKGHSFFDSVNNKLMNPIK